MAPAALLDIFPSLQKVESAVSDYYAACALQWEEDRAFWAALVKEEMAHAQHLKQAAEMVRRRPSEFAPGRPFTPESAGLVIAGITENIEKIAHGEMTADKALQYACVIEQALIEFRYLEIVRSENPAFLALMQEISGQTDAHLANINQRIASLPHNLRTNGK